MHFPGNFIIQAARGTDIMADSGKWHNLRYIRERLQGGFPGTDLN